MVLLVSDLFRSGFSCVLFPLLFGCLENQYQANISFFEPQNRPWNTMARGARRAWRGGSGPRKKKIRLIIGPDPGRRSRLAGRVQVWKNPTRCHSYTKQLYTGYQELTLFSFFFFLSRYYLVNYLGSALIKLNNTFGMIVMNPWV